MSTVDQDLSQVPGAMEHTLTRQIPDGLIEFEESPIGWLKKDGEPRKAPWRAYHFTPTDGQRGRLQSTTTFLDEILPKDGLPPWAEREGIKGTIEAARLGLIGADTTPEEAVEIVRRNKLGAEAAKKRAADRGLNVHAVLEMYMRTGEAPKLAGHPESHRGYLQGLTRWLLKANPEPLSVEELVVNPEDGYAGRLDLRAIIDGELVTCDAKTQEKAGIYPGAHYQVKLYERAAVRCGAEPAARQLVVVFAADGAFREMPAEHHDWQIDAALAHYRASRPIVSACESANRAEKKAREMVGA